MTIDDELPSTLATVATTCLDLPGVEAVVLGGSAARGFADDHSDFDIIAFVDGEVPEEAVRERAFASAHTSSIRSEVEHWTDPQWGEYSFVEESNVKVDVAFRRLASVRERLDSVLTGSAPDPAPSIAHTAFGYCPEVLANEIDECELLIGDADLVAEFRAMIRPYPDKLKRKTISSHLLAVRSNLGRRLREAASRDDFLTFDAFRARDLRSLVRVLFALNETYYPGDGWNRKYIDQFEVGSDAFAETVSQLRSRTASDISAMQQQCDIIETLLEELTDFAIAADAYDPSVPPA